MGVDADNEVWTTYYVNQCAQPGWTGRIRELDRSLDYIERIILPTGVNDFGGVGRERRNDMPSKDQRQLTEKDLDVLGKCKYVGLRTHAPCRHADEYG